MIKRRELKPLNANTTTFIRPVLKGEMKCRDKHDEFLFYFLDGLKEA